MANLYKIYVDYALTDWATAWFELDDAQMDLNSAWALWLGGSDHAALQRTMWTVQHIIDSVYGMLSHDGASSYDPALITAMQLAWEYTIEEPPIVTWKAICEAWVKNDFEGKEWTIACIDHMRKLMWDKPFFIQWASKPEQEQEQT